MFLPDMIVFSDLILAWKKNMFIYKNVISSKNSEKLIDRSENLTAQIV